MSTLPPEAHFIAGKIEDHLDVWNNRDLDHPHPSTAAAGEKIINLCEEMIQAFYALQEATRKDHREYVAALHNTVVKEE